MREPVRLWRRGEPVERAPVLFEVPADRMAAYCSVDDTGPTPRMWFIDRIDFFNLISGSAPRPVHTQSSTCRPTSGWKRIRTGWP
jgi:prolyl oligopeptidase